MEDGEKREAREAMDDPSRPAIEAPLRLHAGLVRPAWIDFNGHMNLAYFMVAFDHATDAFFDYLGMTATHREASDRTPYLLETHVTYVGEMREGEGFRCETQLLDHDRKRLHYFHFMYHAAGGHLVATTELMFVNVHRSRGRSVDFDDEVLERIEAVMRAHATLPRPAHAGSVIGIRRKDEGGARRR